MKIVVTIIKKVGEKNNCLCAKSERGVFVWHIDHSSQRHQSYACPLES